jgi:hypothetical protein
MDDATADMIRQRGMTFATSGEPGKFEMAFRHVRLTAGKSEEPIADRYL